MEVAENTRGAELAGKLNVGEVTSWRLHWLVCALQNLQRTMQNSNISHSRDLTSGPFADAMAEARRIKGNYERLCWETQTMLGLSYPSDVEPLLLSLKHHDSFLDELSNVARLLDKMASQILDVQNRMAQEELKALTRR